MSKREKHMTTLQLEIEDSKLDIVLNIINSLKDDIIKRYGIMKGIVYMTNIFKRSTLLILAISSSVVAKQNFEKALIRY